MISMPVPWLQADERSVALMAYCWLFSTFFVSSSWNRKPNKNKCSACFPAYTAFLKRIFPWFNGFGPFIPVKELTAYIGFLNFEAELRIRARSTRTASTSPKRTCAVPRKRIGCAVVWGLGKILKKRFRMFTRVQPALWALNLFFRSDC